jgi:tetratricopeptide (TPR) repeat protein
VSDAAVLNAFLTAEARAAVVRVREPGAGDEGVFSGFFVSPEGHLITAFHAIKGCVLDLPAEFDLEIELDGQATGRGDTRIRQTVVARCDAGWTDPIADWVLLRLEYRPTAFLPVSGLDVLRPSDGALCSELRVYGFTATEPGLASIGALNGEYLRCVPERGRFHVAYTVRSRGQSGGPVIDLRSRTVIGSVVGYRADEALTGEAAAIDRKRLTGFVPNLDFERWEYAWRVRAARHLCAEHPAFGRISSDSFVPNLPSRHVRDRPTVRRYLSLAAPGSDALFLHGPPGSGKTVLALEIARSLAATGAVGSMFWHDFEPQGGRLLDGLVRRLAVHLLERQGAYEPVEACLDGVVSGAGLAVDVLLAALRGGRHVYVFDNVHQVQRDGDADMLRLLAGIASSARAGASSVLFTSWDPPMAPIEPIVGQVDGFDADEVGALLRLHDVNVSPRTLSWISQLSGDITCVEEFIRSPRWRQEVEAGAPQPAEPETLRRRWLDRYFRQLSPEGRRVLLALAVLAEPMDYQTVEATADVSDFAETLAVIQTSPPLVRSAGGRYYLHFNVARAALASSDERDIRQAHQRAAIHLAATGKPAAAARHRLRAEEHEAALDLLYTHRDEIIAGGKAQELEALIDQLVAVDGPIRSGPHRLHAIMASCANIRGMYAKAQRHWAFALQGSVGGLEAAALRNRRGDSYRLASDYTAALREYELATKLTAGRETVASLTEFGRASLGLAKLHRLRSAYLEALDWYGRAREAFEAVFHQPGLIEADFGLGEVQRLRASWDEAYAWYERSLAGARAYGSREREAYALWGVGEIQRLTGRLDSALGTHQMGLDLCIKVGDTRSEGWALLGVAEIQRAEGQLDEALVAAERALACFESTRSETEIAHALLVLAETRRAAGDSRPDLYAASAEIYERKGVRHSLTLCLLAQAAAIGTPTARPLLERARQLADDCGLGLEARHAEEMLEQGTANQPAIQLNFP